MASKQLPFPILLLLGLLLSPSVTADISPAYLPDANRIDSWHKFYAGLEGAAESEKVKGVNRSFNQIAFRSDADVWGKQEYWATPAEFLAAGAGDCEDFAIAKYFTLLRLGVDHSKLNLVYVKNLSGGRQASAHMVVSYQPDPYSPVFILDSLTSEILQLEQRTDLLPVYGFGLSGLWLIKNSRFHRVGDAEQLGLWRNLSLRMNGLLIAQR